MNTENAGSRGSIEIPHGFSKNVFSRERIKLYFVLTFKVIISHIFPEKFIEIHKVVWKI